MDIFGPAFWLILLTIGVAVLGIALAYAKKRNGERSPAERAHTAAATRAERQAEDRDDS
tara:strand:- start:1061 stop:1237 length:177 start_codon:yes stop_codon:yes gene_type:complete